MEENISLTDQSASLDASEPADAEVLDMAADADLLEEELEELVIEDFTIDGICGVY